jgi:hypothetical protein
MQAADVATMQLMPPWLSNVPWLAVMQDNKAFRQGKLTSARRRAYGTHGCLGWYPAATCMQIL